MLDPFIRSQGSVCVPLGSQQYSTQTHKEEGRSSAIIRINVSCSGRNRTPTLDHTSESDGTRYSLLGERCGIVEAGVGLVFKAVR